MEIAIKNNASLPHSFDRKRGPVALEPDLDAGSTTDEATPPPQKRRKLESDGVLVMASASETSTVRISITGTTTTTFEVSRYLIMNLRYFQILLSGDSSDSTVDVDTEAMHVFLLILHHKYDWLPSNRSIDQMAALADLCVEIDSDDTQDDLASSSNDLTAHGILSSSKHVADWISKLWDNGRPVDPDWLRWDGILAQLTDQSEPCSRIITVSSVLAANMYENDGKWVFGTARTPVKTEQTSVNETLVDLEGVREDLFTHFRDSCYVLLRKETKKVPHNVLAIGQISLARELLRSDLSEGESLLGYLRQVEADLPGQEMHASVRTILANYTKTYGM